VSKRDSFDPNWSVAAERYNFTADDVDQVLRTRSQEQTESTTLKPSIKPLCDGLVREGEKRSGINGGRTRTRTWGPAD
jgi:hypothetical protein